MGPLRSTSHYLLKTLLAIFIIGLLLVNGTFTLWAQQEDTTNHNDIRNREFIFAEEAPATLFNLSRNDESVKLAIQGNWETGITAQEGIALTELGLQAATTNNPLLFTQTVDLTLSLWIKDHWFVEASFLDDYELNTYRAGYQGSEEEPLQYLGIGNTGLDFPRFPYLDMGGSSTSSFGMYNKWKFTFHNDTNPSQPSTLILHGILRYDSAKLQEKNYIGNREITTETINVSEMIRGYSFVLPDTDLDTVPVLYIEDSSGDQVDENGSRWRLAKTSEYAASARDGIIEITNASVLAVGRRLAVAYRKSNIDKPWETSLGTYGNTSTAGSGFLGTVQEYFNTSSGTKIILRDYPQPGQKDQGKLKTDNNKPATVTIGGIPALVIWEGGTFSPFERLSRYRIQTGSSSTVKLINTATGTENRDFTMESASSLIHTEGSSTSASTALYELVTANGTYDPRSPESCWPLVKVYPELYLPASKATSINVQILITTYGSPGVFSIGTNVLPGSVQVYRNGLPDPLVRYNAETGEVVLSNKPQPYEHIRIQYLQRTEERRFGSLAAGLGAQYTSGGPFSADLAIGLRWNVNPEAFSEGDTTSPGTVGLSGALKWNWEHLSIQTTAGLLYRQEDTTGLYRILGMEGSQYAESFPTTGFYQSPVPTSLNDFLATSPTLTSSNQAPLVYRSYTSTDILGISTLNDISWSGARVISDKTGPYLVQDNTLDTRVLVGEATYSDETFWAGFQLPLEHAASALAGARKITIPYRFYDVPSSLNGITVKVYLQIGALDGATSTTTTSTESTINLTGWENSALVLTVPLFDSTSPSVGVLPTQWQTATITLSDTDRRALANARSMRLVVVTGGTDYQFRTRILLGPPVVSGTSMRPIIVSGGQPLSAITDTAQSVDAAEVGDPMLRNRFRDTIDTLHPEGNVQRVLEVHFSDLLNATGVGVDSRIALPFLGNYRTLQLFVRGPKATNYDQNTMQNGVLSLVIAQDSDSFSSPILRARIPIAVFTADEWSKVEIRYNDQNPQVLVDGAVISGALVTFDAVQGASPSQRSGDQTYQYLAVYLLPPANNEALPNGTFAIDEILLTEPVASFQGHSGIYAQWTNQGPLITIRNIPVLSNLNLASYSEGFYQSPIEAPYPTTFGNVSNQTKTTFSLLWIPIELYGGITLNSYDMAWNGGHKITLPIGPIQVIDDYDVSQTSYNHQNTISIDIHTSSTKTPLLFTSLSATSAQEDLVVQRAWNITQKGFYKRFFLESSGDLTYKHTTDTYFSNSNTTYIQTWNHSLSDLTPDVGTTENNRSSSLRLKGGLTPQTFGFITDAIFTSNAKKSLISTEQGLTHRLSFPFSIQSIKGILEHTRQTNQTITEYGIDITSDLYQYTNFIKNTYNLYILPPGYSLLTQNLENMMNRSQQNQGDTFRRLTFTDTISFSLQLPSPTGPWGLLFPAKTQTKVSRIGDLHYTSYTDKLSWDSTISASAVNLFGSYGYTPMFSFYRDDEYTQQLNLNVSWVDRELSAWKTGIHQTADFYGFSGSTLEVSHILYLMQTGWSDSLSLSWAHPAPKSLLGVLFKGIIATNTFQKALPAVISYSETAPELIQKESLETKIDSNSSNDSLIWDTTARHESILRIKNQLNITAFGSVAYSQNITENTFTLIGSTGIYIKIQF
ncbi:hypothetical protein [Gracilinema caldarium]|uniref:Uncharacterized protein n=1 Tax=Gracilinema caldarium (strain ATCC 51460 / DSM 7334 / H1) TaxID=744872 RepID=F8EXQ4_GRAC1|nr:hypothetical protein [Gracilinema caldarium]AEJ19635.1 hypothetical protein Spica_1491 [Gracilinema caldarium DSM 7334]